MKTTIIRTRKALGLLLLMAAMLVSAPAKAQFQFGIRGGANLVNMKLSGSSTFDKDNRAGFYVGPTVKFTVPIVGLSLDASALYDQKTAKVDDVDIKAQSIEIPINVRYGIGLSSLANIFLFAGPQFGFNIASDKKFADSAEEWTWKSSNVSVNVGVGCTLLKHLEVKANYNIACTKSGKSKSDENIAAKYNSWQLGLAYYF
ncbi:MAG: porin family protein [Prevotellaceae bacterium]|nr:porin family protein [Prevotellaceae bacterium]